jgi:hypothetical protein
MSSGATAGIIITLGVLFIIGGTTAVIVWSWHRLQQHRADAVAMASYRKLAEEAVANQAGMFLPLLIMGVAVFTVWLTLLAGVTAPLWYWAPVEH